MTRDLPSNPPTVLAAPGKSSRLGQVALRYRCQLQTSLVILADITFWTQLLTTDTGPRRGVSIDIILRV